MILTGACCCKTIRRLDDWPKARDHPKANFHVLAQGSEAKMSNVTIRPYCSSVETVEIKEQTELLQVYHRFILGTAREGKYRSGIDRSSLQPQASSFKCTLLFNFNLVRVRLSRVTYMRVTLGDGLEILIARASTMLCKSLFPRCVITTVVGAICKYPLRRQTPDIG